MRKMLQILRPIVVHNTPLDENFQIIIERGLLIHYLLYLSNITEISRESRSGGLHWSTFASTACSVGTAA